MPALTHLKLFDRLLLALVAVAMLAAGQLYFDRQAYSLTSAPPVTTGSIVSCGASYERYYELPMDAPLSYAEERFGCKGRLIHEGDRYWQTWQFPGENGHTVYLHTTRGYVTSKTWF